MRLRIHVPEKSSPSVLDKLKEWNASIVSREESGSQHSIVSDIYIWNLILHWRSSCLIFLELLQWEFSESFILGCLSSSNCSPNLHIIKFQQKKDLLFWDAYMCISFFFLRIFYKRWKEKERKQTISDKNVYSKCREVSIFIYSIS